MTDESKIPQTDLTESTQLELGGANLDHVLAFYNDGSAKLFKPQQRGIIEIKFEDYVPVDAERKPCCIIASILYCPCPTLFLNPNEVNVTDLSKAAQSELGGDSLNYVLASYTDDSARLFKPQQRDMIIEVRFEASTPSPSVLETNAQSLQSASGDSMSFASSRLGVRSSCTLGSIRYTPCPF